MAGPKKIPEKQFPIMMGYFQSIMDYFGIQWLILLSYLVCQVDVLSENRQCAIHDDA